jgi:hypothetical protein
VDVCLVLVLGVGHQSFPLPSRRAGCICHSPRVARASASLDYLLALALAFASPPASLHPYYPLSLPRPSTEPNRR